MNPPPAPRLRDLKAAAQLLKSRLKIGRDGVSPGFLAALDQALCDHELVKVRFEQLKAEKKTLAPELAAKTGSRLVMRVGHVAVYYRPRLKTLSAPA
jgi:RNA-binding protein